MKSNISTSLALLTSFSGYCGGYKSALTGVTSNRVGQRLRALHINPNTSRTFSCSTRNIHRSQSKGANPGLRLRMANDRYGEKFQKNGIFLFDFDGGEHIMSCIQHWKIYFLLPANSHNNTPFEFGSIIYKVVCDSCDEVRMRVFSG